MASAQRAGLDVVALTDHDTTRGWGAATEAAGGLGIGLVRGIEISCSRDGRSVHLLGYLFDPTYAGLLTEIEAARHARLTRMDAMVERMAADGIPITIEKVRAHVAAGATLGRPHLADALVAAGLVPDRAAAFRDYLHDESPYYVSHYAVDPVRGVELVTAAGGVAVVAHPFTRSLGRSLDVDLVEEMAAAGMAGIEANHRDHGPEEVARALAVASAHDLIVTGSSDYHGTGKPNRLGENSTTPSALAAILERATGVDHLPA
jgi:predicted metal-dependent phosphoesterase TrpH